MKGDPTCYLSSYSISLHKAHLTLAGGKTHVQLTFDTSSFLLLDNQEKKSFTQSKRHLAANKREKILSSQVIKAILATFLNNERCLEITESKKKIHLCDKMAMPFKRTRSPHNVGYLVATNQWRPRNSLKSHDLYRFESERCVISSGRPLGVPKETTFPSSHGQHLVVTVFLSAAEIFCCLIIFLIEKPREFGKHDVKPSSNNR